jgi:hypothetical protein
VRRIGQILILFLAHAMLRINEHRREPVTTDARKSCYRAISPFLLPAVEFGTDDCVVVLKLVVDGKIAWWLGFDVALQK